jgi:hypothetical protein
MIKIFIVLLLFTSITFSQSDNKWVTKFEKSGYISTSSYDETINYFQNLADQSEYATLFNFGVSPQGRNLKYLLVTKENINQNNPDELSQKVELKKATILIINGIHSGEIEGKDASMLLLRDILITKEKEYLLDNINLIVVAIFSVDGHERKNKFNRINQNGPEEMGWRTTAQNFNLNRDWMKADSPEMQGMLRLFNKYLPDFVIDTHTTDGADYQYTVTYQVEKFSNIYSGLGNFLKNNFVPYLEKNVEQKGFLIFPYVGFRNWEKREDIKFYNWASGPRLSTGYFALQNCPSLLIETHMIKPYKERVYATIAVLETTLQFVSENTNQIKKLRKEADEYSAYQLTKYSLPLSFTSTDEFEAILFKGYDYYLEKSEISGVMKIVYTNNPIEIPVKYYKNVAAIDSIDIAAGYLIPKEYDFLLDRIKLHGIDYSMLKNDTPMVVTRYKFKDVKFAETSNESRQQVKFIYDTYGEEKIIPAGTILIRTNQRTSRIITKLLEPKSSDSFVQWGFMNQIFEQKEYFEDYVMEKIAEEMLIKDSELKKEFEQKLNEDESFRNNSYERLNFFYKKSPYWDNQLNLYPIMRVE